MKVYRLIVSSEEELWEEYYRLCKQSDAGVSVSSTKGKYITESF